VSGSTDTLVQALRERQEAWLQPLFYTTVTRLEAAEALCRAVGRIPIDDLSTELWDLYRTWQSTLEKQVTASVVTGQ
jgi:hypothetical protein